jgi:hypothetical protein
MSGQMLPMSKSGGGSADECGIFFMNRRFFYSKAMIQF